MPEWLKMQHELSVATARWLCSVALNCHPSSITSATVSSHETSDYLSCIPEFILSNVTDFVLFLSRFSQPTLDNVQLDDFLTLVVVFMGSPQRLKNPHLRAGLAETLDNLIPSDKSTLPGHRTNIFLNHPLANQLVGTLLHVFSSIEMTGQGVRFEEKFNYRRPMYDAMKFLWNLSLHRDQFK